jgi:hypothetical protein
MLTDPQQKLYNSARTGKFTFNSPDGLPVTYDAAQLSPDELKRLSDEGYTGSFPFAHPTSRWAEGSLENLRELGVQDIAKLRLLHGEEGTRPFLDDAEYTLREEVDNDNLQTLTDALATYGSFGLAGPQEGADQYLAETGADVNWATNAVGAGVAMLPTAVAGGAAAEALTAGRLAGGGAIVAEELGAELVAGVQMTLGDYAMQDKQFSSEAFLADTATNVLFGTGLGVGVRGVASKVAKGLGRAATRVEDMTPAQKMINEDAVVETRLKEVLDPSKSDAQVIADVETTLSNSADEVLGMKPGQLRSIAEAMPVAERTLLDTSTEIAEAAPKLQGVLDGGAKAFSEFKRGVSATLDDGHIKNTVGALQNISKSLDVRIRGIEEVTPGPDVPSSVLDSFGRPVMKAGPDIVARKAVRGSVDAQYLSSAKNTIENFITNLKNVDQPGGINRDVVIDQLDSLADTLWDVRANPKVPSDILELQATIRETIKHSDGLLGEAGQVMRQADELSVAAIKANDNLKNRLFKDSKPLSINNTLRGKESAQDIVAGIQSTQELIDIGKAFEALPDASASAYGKAMRESAADLQRKLTGLIANGPQGVSPIGMFRQGEKAAKMLRSDEGKKVLGGMLRDLIVAGGFLTGMPGLGFVIARGTEIVGAWKATGSTKQIGKFGVVHQTNTKTYDGIKRGAAALSKALTGKRTPTVTGLTGVVGAATARKYKNEDEKRASFEDMARDIAELTSDPMITIQKLERPAGAVASYDRDMGEQYAMASVRAAQYLSDNLPPAQTTIFGKRDTSSIAMADIDKWLMTAEIISNPTKLLEEVASGTIEPFMVEAVATVYPKLHNEMVMTAIEVLGEAEQVPHYMHSPMSTLLGFSVDPLQEPGALAVLQSQGAQTQAQDQVMRGSGRARVPSKSYVTSVTRVGEM